MLDGLVEVENDVEEEVEQTHVLDHTEDAVDDPCGIAEGRKTPRHHIFSSQDGVVD